MIKLLMGITLSEVGGSQRVVFDLISQLPESLYEITLVTAPGGELLDWIEELNQNRLNKVKLITMKSLKRKISPICDLKVFLRLFFIIKIGKYDVAHFHNSKIGVMGRIAAKLANLPKIFYTVHGWGLNKLNIRVMYKFICVLERMISSFTTRVIFVSKEDMQKGINNEWASKSNSCLIYNGISLNKKSKSCIEIAEKPLFNKNVPIIAFVARLAEPKDPFFAIRVSKQLKNIGLNHILLIIGTGPLHVDCTNLIKMLGAESHVIMLGNCSNVREILSRVDIFCLFSKSEGLPISIIEAMYAGLPVVANRVGGIPELITNGETGYILESLNTERAVYILSTLIKDKQKRLAFGNAGQSVAIKSFSSSKMVAQYRELYESEQGVRFSEK